MEINRKLNSNRTAYKIVLLFIVCCSFIVMEVSAQYSMDSFSACSSYISKVLDITWKKPKGFIWKKTGNFLWSQGNREIGAIYEATMQSKDKDYLILYPNMSFMLADSGMLRNQLNGDPALARRQMMADVNDALETSVVMLVGKDAPFNADTVFVAHIPLKKNYQEIYTYCIGIYACKQGRPSMIFKCFFTNEGKQNEKKFLSKFYKTVRYRNNDNWVLDGEKSQKERYRQYLKSIK